MKHFFCVQVYECLQRYVEESPAPTLDYAAAVSFQVVLRFPLIYTLWKCSCFKQRTCALCSAQLLTDIRSLPGCSEDAKELYRLLRQPHLQVRKSLLKKDFFLDLFFSNMCL